MFGKTRAAIAGVAVSLLVAGSTVFMATTAANATNPVDKAINVLGYGDGDANKYVDNIAAPAAEFGGKVVSVDWSKQHLFVTNPADNTTVDVAPWLSDINDGDSDTRLDGYLDWDLDNTGSITGIQYDGKFYMWVYTYLRDDANYDDDWNGYDLLYSDGTAAGTGIIRLEDGNGHPLDGLWGQNQGMQTTTAAEDGIYFAKLEFTNHWYCDYECENWNNQDLYYFDPSTVSSGVGVVTDLNVDGINPPYGSEVLSLTTIGGHASWLVESYDNNNIFQKYATNGVVYNVGEVQTPDSNWYTPAHGWTDYQPLKGNSQTSTNAYAQFRFTTDQSGYWSEDYLLTTDAYDNLYTLVNPGNETDVNMGDFAIYDDYYYYSSGSGDLFKVDGTEPNVVETAIDDPYGFVVANNKLYYYGWSEWDYDYGIFSVDAANNVHAVDGNWDSGFDYVVGAGVDGKFYYRDWDAESGYEVWVQEANGDTHLADDINQWFYTGDNDSNPDDFVTIGGKVYLKAYNWQTGSSELYVMGTAEAPVAESLATGDAIYALNCDSSMPTSLGTLDTSTGAITGTGNVTNPSYDCFAQATYDPTTGLSYAIDWDYNDGSLVNIDVETGLRTYVGNFVDQNGNGVDMYTMAIDNYGVAYGLDYDGALYTIDLESGDCTEVDWLNVNGDYLADGVSGYPDGRDIRALAVDPTTNTLYAGEYSEGDNTLIFSIDTATAEVTEVGNWGLATGGTEEELRSMQFDSEGTLWVYNSCGYYGDCGPRTLWSTSDMSDFNNTTVKASETSFDGDPWFWFESVLITRGDQNTLAAGTQPVDDTLFSLNCDSSNPYLLTNVSVADASGTGVGTSNPEAVCYTQGAWNPVTKKAYAIDGYSYNYSGLVEFNPTTGRPTFIGEFRTSLDGDNWINASSIAIDNGGNAYMWHSDQLFSVDLDTAVVTLIGNSDANNTLSALAVNPLNNKLYGIDHNGDRNVYEINKTTGEATIVDSYDSDQFEGNIVSLQFKQNGVAIVLVDGEGDKLWTGAIGDGMDTFTKSGVVKVSIEGETDPYYYSSEALLYVPGAGRLASTGVDASVATTAALGGFLALAAGVVLVARRRRTAQQ